MSRLFSAARLTSFTAGLLLMASLCLGSAVAAPPFNDDIAHAQGLGSLDADLAILDWTEATRSPDDPLNPCEETLGITDKNVWYRYTTGAATEYLNLWASGAEHDDAFAVYESTTGGLQPLVGGCVRGRLHVQAYLVGARLLPNRTYFIEARVEDPFAILHFAHSPVYHVTTEADTADGHCDSHCSLREAVTASNLTPGVILFDQPGVYRLSRTGTDENDNATGDLDIRRGVAIYGLGRDLITLDGMASDRVIDARVIQRAETFTIGDVAILNGQPHDTQVSLIQNLGGGILNFGWLDGGHLFMTIFNARFALNSATGGGAILLTEWALIVDTEFSFNSASSSGGAILKASVFQSVAAPRMDAARFPTITLTTAAHWPSTACVSIPRRCTPTRRASAARWRKGGREARVFMPRPSLATPQPSMARASTRSRRMPPCS